MRKYARLERIMIAFILLNWLSFLATILYHLLYIPKFPKWSLWFPPIMTGLLFLVSVTLISIRVLKSYIATKRKLDASKRRADIIHAQEVMIKQYFSDSSKKPVIIIEELEDFPEPKKVRETELQPSIATCMICKLEIRKRQQTKKCPFCKSLFHKNHLINWLKTHEKCPVCSKAIRNRILS